MKKNKIPILLILILIFAFALRIFQIDSNPKAMYGDSLTLVYDAYSILKTGHDQRGEFFPLYFSMGGGRPGGYIYATIPFVAIFGPTALAARTLSVLSGVGIVLLIYLILFHLFPQNKKVALAGAIFSTISPWDLSLSREAFESHFALFLSLLGFYLLLKAQKKYLLYLLSGLSFALSIQTYSTYVLVIPIFVAFFLILSKSKISKMKMSQKLALGSLCLIVTLSLLFSIYISKSRGSQDRFSNLIIFNQADLQNKISGKVISERTFSPLGDELALTLHNKYWEYAGYLAENYINNFGPSFLFLTGDENPRHNPASMGELYYFMFPLLILGILYLYTRNKEVLVLLVGWMLIAPLSSSLVGNPHALRGSFMLPPLLMLSAFGVEGIYMLRNPLKFKILKLALILLFLIQLPFFVNRFYLLAPHIHAHFWSYSAKEASYLALENKDKYDYILLSTRIDDMEFAYPVYTKIDPKEFLYQSTHKTNFGEYSFIKFDNVYLGSIPSGKIKEIVNSLSGSVMYLGPIEDKNMVDNEVLRTDRDRSILFVISTKENSNGN